MTVGIIGGGIAGVALANALHKEGIAFELYEKGNTWGGNAQTLRWDNFFFDSGAHRFHHQIDEATAWVKDLLGNDLELIEVPSAIFWKNRYIDFPISPVNLLVQSGFKSSIKGLLSFVATIFCEQKEKNNFEQSAISRYGRYWAKQFLLDYSEKLWGLPCDQLSTEISGKRLNGLSLKSMMYEIFGGKKKKTAHLDGSFYYPRHGIGMLTSRLIEQLDRTHLHLSSDISQIVTHDFKITHLSVGGTSVPLDRLVSTVPLGVLITLLSPAPPKEVLEAAASLRYRSLHLILLKVNLPRIEKWGSIYFPESSTIFTRAYEPKNRSLAMAPKDSTSLVLEVPCFLDHEMNVEEIKNKAIEQLLLTNIVKKENIIDSKIITMPNAYPVLSLKDIENKKIVEEYLAKFSNLDRIGRSGRFVYSHIHDILKEAKCLAQAITPDIPR